MDSKKPFFPTFCYCGMGKKRAIVWFRKNLRIKDNILLQKTNSKDFEILPIYIIDEKLFENNPIGTPRAGENRLRFLIESIIDLQLGLKELGSNLYIFKGNSQKLVVELAQLHKINYVFTSKLPGVEEEKEELLVESELFKNKIAFESTWDSTLFDLKDLPFPITRLPNVFTSFRKEVEKGVMIKSPESIHTLHCTTIEIGPGPTPDNLTKELNIRGLYTNCYKGGEKKAWERLNYYFWETEKINTYKETRNYMCHMDNSTKLSAYLSVGSISSRLIYHELKNYEKEKTANDSTYWLFFELLWRDYFHFVSRKYKSLMYHIGGLKKKLLKWDNDPSAFSQWCNGKTGVDIVDANMAELNQTGFLSNRGRQIVASYLVNDLKIDWTWGAYYFENHLIDYDQANNWGNWCYLAGVGNDPRSDRYFNTETQTKKYDPDGLYVKKWLHSHIDEKMQ